MKVDKNQLIIDVRSIDQPSFEALVDFAEAYKNLPSLSWFRSGLIIMHGMSLLGILETICK